MRLLQSGKDKFYKGLHEVKVAEQVRRSLSNVT